MNLKGLKFKAKNFLKNKINISGHFVTTSNSPNATASMNSVSSAFRH